MDKAYDLVMNILKPQFDAMPITDKDYLGLEGLVHCALCKTPKQMYLTIGDNKYIVKVLCECQGAQLDKEEAADRQRKKEMKMNRWREDIVTDTVWKDYTFENDDHRDDNASEKAHAYVANFESMTKNNAGLMLYGGIGCGKTYLAAAISNRINQRGFQSLMTSISSLVTAITEDFGANKAWWLDKIANLDLLVLDDFGVERTTAYSTEQMYEVINARYKSNKPLIITTNLSMKDFQNEQSQALLRIYDRIKEMCVPVFVQGESRRLDIAKAKHDAAKEILEGRK